MADALSELCQLWRVSGGVHFRCELGRPWGLRIGAQREGVFHLVERGCCWLKAEGASDSVALGTGDLLLLPHGDGHALVDVPQRAPLPMEFVVGARAATDRGPVIHGGAGERTDILCGWLKFDRALAHPLLSALPARLLIRAADLAQAPALGATLALIRTEAREASPGADAVLGRLVEILLIQVVRWRLGSRQLPAAAMAALTDRRLSTALECLHGEPEKTWTIASLAQRAGCSRAVFASRFREQMGCTPLQYLTEWRMQRAVELLANPRACVARVAHAVGYCGEASFGKAFKRHTGIAPGAYRKRHGSAGATGSMAA